ncbi:unnamed protein product [Calicophoron daubneyi]|uniref:Uncharacterized protein n=1 Tax=Calicophoron daubneyi TaxID=300641 RepID=A0AAV2SXR8_CALDB
MASNVTEGDGYAIRLQLAYFATDGDAIPACPKFRSNTIFFEFQMQNTTFHFVRELDRSKRSIFFGKNLSSTQPNSLMFEGLRERFFKPQPKVYISLGYEKTGKRSYVIKKRLVEIPIYTKNKKTEMARLSIRCTRLGFFYQPCDIPTPWGANSLDKHEGIAEVRDSKTSNLTYIPLRRDHFTRNRLLDFVTWISNFFSHFLIF